MAFGRTLDTQENVTIRECNNSHSKRTRFWLLRDTLSISCTSRTAHMTAKEIRSYTRRSPLPIGLNSWCLFNIQQRGHARARYKTVFPRLIQCDKDWCCGVISLKRRFKCVRGLKQSVRSRSYSVITRTRTVWVRRWSE